MINIAAQNHWQNVHNKFNLSPNELHIWRYILPMKTDHLNNLWTLLSAKEKKQAEQFHFSKDKVRYITARGILKKLCAGYTKGSPETVQFNYNPYGKPLLQANYNDLHFNLSHSHDCVVYAFTIGSEVGIDIELLNEDSSINEIAKYCFSQPELEILSRLSGKEQYHYFYKIWTLKEAFSKALGLGLSMDLRPIEMKINPHNLNIFIKFIEKQEENKWNLQFFTPHTDYYAAFATQQSLKKILFFNYNSVL